ncbi:hypothetical protein GCK72_004502 [Caenorhabditis remanei]|uniref:Uncharacterized protein n=1 Tax=Caenorhabditis remanei TaxID=31234 RepID=A0A6A5HDU7_CAERE|nr:hypothetical protein GCK72_004502 [Caenorhabditis remanei]KAF1764553.1 hypothetical protein GCK72_004502 [Caenorhabditis remanei]
MPSQNLLSYDLLTTMFNLNDPHHLLKLLKNSLINIQDNEKEEASVDQIKELMKMEKWMNLKRTSLKTKIEKAEKKASSEFGALFFFFILLSAIIVYLIYTGQSISLASRLWLSAGGIFLLSFVGLCCQMMCNFEELSLKKFKSMSIGENDDDDDDFEYQRNFEKVEVFESLMMFELRNRHVDLIDSFIDTINPLKQKAKVWKNRERIQMLLFIILFATYFLFRVVHSSLQLFPFQNNVQPVIIFIETINLIFFGLFFISAIHGMYQENSKFLKKTFCLPEEELNHVEKIV